VWRGYLQSTHIVKSALAGFEVGILPHGDKWFLTDTVECNQRTPHPHFRNRYWPEI